MYIFKVERRKVKKGGKVDKDFEKDEEEKVFREISLRINLVSFKDDKGFEEKVG